MIYVIGSGPGNKDFMTLEAIEAIKKCDTIVGYKTYINLIKDLVKNNFGISIIYKVAVMDELEKNELIMLDINSMKLSHEFNFIYLKDSIFASEYVDFFNKINNF